MSKRLLILGLLAGLFAFSADVRPTLRVPPFSTPPVIDGSIGEAEWQCAARQFGSQNYNSTVLHDRQAIFFLGWDSRNLYFACRSELPPGDQKILSRVRKDGLRVTMDDTVELHVYPPNGKYGYQLIYNPCGARFTAKYEVLSGATIFKGLPFDPKGVVCASTQKDGHWDIEMSVPLTELAVQGEPDSSAPWGFQMVRSWHNPDEPSSWTKAPHFCDIEYMGNVWLDKQAPAVSFLGLGKDYAKGEYDIRFRVFNGTDAPRTVRCLASVKSTAAPRLLSEERTIPVGESRDFSLCYTEKADFTYDFDAQISDAGTGAMLMQRAFSWNPPKKNRWESLEQKLNSVELEMGFYPYRNVVKARYGSPDLPASREVVKVQFAIEGKDGTAVKPSVSGQKGPCGYLMQWNLDKPLPTGDYRVVALVQWKDGKQEKLVKEFINRHFEWEHNGIGRERVIVPPFRPLKTDAQKREVHAILTGYRCANGFWDAIYAQGENILSAPVSLAVNGKADYFRERDFRFAETADDRVTALAQLTGEAVALDVRHEYDYDGMCKTTLTFRPQGEFSVRDLVLTVPLKEEVATMYHCVNDVPRYHPADFLPTRQGVLWDSRQGKLHPGVTGNFWPYVWFGGQHKGVCWFAASDRNWSLDYQRPALELVREKGSVALRVHLVNMPVKWTGETEIVLGFQPTPVKPQPKGWRALSFQNKPAPHAIASSIIVSWSWGTIHGWDCWPVEYDYEVVNRLARANRVVPGKCLDKENIEAFIAKHRSAIPSGKEPIMRDHLHRSRVYSRFCDYLFPYVNPRAADGKWESYQVFQNEWFHTEYRTPIDYDEYNIEAAESYQDMILWNLRRALREGFDGLYYDNVRVRATHDPVRGPAYLLPNGKVQPFFDFFSFRELLKRTATMLYLEHKTMPDGRPWFVQHMTNGSLIPFLSFAGFQLDLESEYGPKEFHDRFSQGYFLSETVGTQAGCVPQILCSITGNQIPWVTRTFVNYQLAFDISMVLWQRNPDPVVRKTWETIFGFGYGTPQCEVIPSFAEGTHPVVCDNPQVRVSVYRRTDKEDTLLAVCNMANEDLQVSLDFTGLGYLRDFLVDMESQEKVPCGNRHATLHLPRRDFRLLRYANSTPN